MSKTKDRTKDKADNKADKGSLVVRMVRWPLRTGARMAEQRPALWLLAALVLAPALYFGSRSLERVVHGLPKYDRALSLQWEALPDWLRLDDNRHILDGLTRQVDLRPTDRLLDQSLACRLADNLAPAKTIWVRKVERVLVRPDGIVSVWCQFRRPTAWVRQGKSCYLVDEDGVRLPGQYDAVDCRDGALFVIDGVDLAPPAVGQPWRGADVAAGIRLARLLTGHPFSHQIADILVANYDGRRDRDRPYIELTTDRQGSRVWWGRPPDEEFGTEITATQKLTLLGTLYRRWGRIDLNRDYVSIMTWPDRIAVPVDAPSKPGRLLRG